MPPKPKYVKKDHIDHILTRADMYIGSNKTKKTEDYVAIEVEDNEYKIVKQNIDINPGLLRIFVEALSNAIDNVKRSESTTTKCTKIKVNIDKKTGETIIWNDGQVVPIEINDEGDYNHTMIFGQLMTSSNYDDEEERLVSGRNGIGIKATNIYSKFFQVRGFDPEAGKILEQSWENNMRDISKPKITSNKAKNGFTEIKYIPDFERFGMKSYTDDTINLYRKYVCDAAMLSKVSVYFNDNLVPVKNLIDYSKLYSEDSKEVTEIKTDNADVVITPSNGDYEAISFVNGVYTSQGGKHVDSWCESIFRPLVQKFNKPKKPQVNITDIKKFFRIFVNVTVVNPEFSSQSKTEMVSPEVASSVPLKNITAIMKWEFVEQIEDIIRSKEFLALKKSEKKTKGFKKIEGLDHANNAGGKLSKDCILILTEGLSAKTYAVTGIQEGWNGFKGRDFFGVFGLRGKCLNVRNANITAIAKNKEITDVVQALGVRYGIDYKEDKNFESLNYGRLMILADADCFTHDTPVVIRKNNIIDIVSMERLGDKQWVDDTNICINTEVWSDNGWTRIEGLRRLYTTKKVIQINTHCGMIRCTEDHKMLLENGREILAKDIKIGDNLMRTRRIKKPVLNDSMFHSEMKDICNKLQCYKQSLATSKDDFINEINKESFFCNPNEYIGSSSISVNEAFVWGLFFADGTCGIYTFDNDRKTATERNTKASRYRWLKWVDKYKKRIEVLENIEILTIKQKKLLYATKKRLQLAIENSSRTSSEKEKNLMRTNYSWSISNCDLELLEKSKNIMENCYPEYNWTIKEVSVSENQSRQWRLILNGGKKVSEFIENMRTRFYDPIIRENKKVPFEILNAPVNIQSSFFDGYYAGDGFRALKKNSNAMGFDVLGQIGAQGLCYIVERLGYSVNIREKKSKPNVFTIHMSNRYRRKYPGEVYDIKEVEYKDKYVYDLQTENHHLNAGIGGIVVHNCDGIHIKGLILNFIHSLFPTLLEREQPFVVSMQTPIVKVFLKTKSILFYDQQKFKEYSDTNSDKKLTVKYYKGLGTSSDAEVLETFGKRVVELLNDKDALVNMNKVFHKSHADDRKVWIGNYNPNADLGIEIDESPITQVNITDFIDKEMIKFSVSDCARSIPNMMDGFKESHRKTLHACFLKKLNYGGQTLKVAQLAGFVAEKTNYHHGEQNLFDTITKMAHDFPGSNNIPLLFRDGQFGSRNSLGKDAANARYIFTKLDILTRLIFRPEDDCLLEHVIDDGDKVEPLFYVPIIPMVLVNGVIAGIGTGWSCNVPSYNPLEIIDCIKIWLNNNTAFETSDDGSKISLFPELKPWYRGFEGRIEKDSDKRYTTYGNIIQEGKDKIIVNELPISMSIDKFKEYIEDQLEEKHIKSMKNYSTPTKVNFAITESPSGFKCTEENLKLKSYIYTSNMVLFTDKGTLNKYETIDDIIDSFCNVRYDYYIKRKEYILNDLKKQLRTLENKARFLKEVMNDELIIFKRNEDDISTEMQTKGYDKEDDTYDYLLRLQVRSFTNQKIETLESDIKTTKTEIKTIQNTTEKQMWNNDLDSFTKAYTPWLKTVSVEKQKTKNKK